MTRLTQSQLAPWAGLFLGALGWFLHHQLGSDANNWDCKIANGAYVVVVGLVCALIALAGGLISWASRPPEGADLQVTRGFARLVGMASAAIFLLTISFQTLAGVLVPACFR
ncbi:MAG: hypothetical protein ACJ798_02055 [Phenylobacterium sp.]